MFIWEEVISGNVSREWGSEPGKGRQPAQSVMEPRSLRGASVEHVPLRHPEGQGSRGAPTPIPWHFPRFWPAPGYKGGCGGRRRPSGKEMLLLAVGGQARVH